jgi:hypothetical protein
VIHLQGPASDPRESKTGIKKGINLQVSQKDSPTAKAHFKGASIYSVANGFTSREPPKPALSPQDEKRHLIYSVAEPPCANLVFEFVNKQPFIFRLFAAQVGNSDSVDNSRLHDPQGLHRMDTLKELESQQKFPPLQAPETYNLSGILAEVKKGLGTRKIPFRQQMGGHRPRHLSRNGERRPAA